MFDDRSIFNFCWKALLGISIPKYGLKSSAGSAKTADRTSPTGDDSILLIDGVSRNMGVSVSWQILKRRHQSTFGRTAAAAGRPLLGFQSLRNPTFQQRFKVLRDRVTPGSGGLFALPFLAPVVLRPGYHPHRKRVLCNVELPQPGHHSLLKWIGPGWLLR